MDFETIKIYFLLRLDTGTVTVMKQCYISIKKKKRWKENSFLLPVFKSLKSD